MIERMKTTATWKVNGLTAEVRVIREHPLAPGWYQVEAVSGTHWVHRSDITFN